MIVFDASTLIVLSQARLLGLVLDAYDGDVAAPQAVVAEVNRGDHPDAEYIQSRLDDGRIRTVDAGSGIEAVMEAYGIERGEAEALRVAENTGGSLVATDDGRAIRACRSEGVPYALAAAFVVRAAEKGLIPEREAHDKLAEMGHDHGYRHALVEDAHGEVG